MFEIFTLVLLDLTVNYEYLVLTYRHNTVDIWDTVHTSHGTTVDICRTAASAYTIPHFYRNNNRSVPY